MAEAVETLLQEILRHVQAPTGADTGRTNTLLLDISQRLAVVETQSSAILVEQRHAAEVRSKVYTDINGLQRDVDDLKRTAGDHGPKLRAVYEAYTKGQGAAGVGRLAWAALVSMGGGAVGYLLAKFGLK